MTGRRLPDGTDWSPSWQPGDYSKMPYGWIVCTPNGEIGSLVKHTVTEHEDGTITVSPSILIYPHQSEIGPTPGWHGFLERGVWRSC
jgi:hypothetical protein